MTESGRICLFSNGDELWSWLQANCQRCARHDACDLEDAIWPAYYGDGTVSDAVAERLGYTPACRAVLGWPCAERVEVTP